MTPDLDGPLWAPFVGVTLLFLFLLAVAVLLEAATRFHLRGLDRIADATRTELRAEVLAHHGLTEQDIAA